MDMTVHKLYLWGIGTLGRFSATFNKGDNFCDFLFCFPATKSLPTGVYSKREEFAPEGRETCSKESKYFPFKVDPFSEGRQKCLKELPPL